MNARIPRALALTALLAPIVLGQPAQDAPTNALRFIWTSPVREGKSDAADSITARRIAYLKANHSRAGAAFHALTNYGPPTRQITTIAGFMNMPAMEQLMTTLDEEEGWLALEEGEEDIFLLEERSFHMMLPVVLRDPPGPPMMFWWRRTARVDPSHLARALQFARAEAAYMKEHYPAVRIEVYAGVGESLGSLFWFGEFASSDIWREVQTRLWQDDAYLQLMEGASGLFVEGSWEEVLNMRRF